LLLGALCPDIASAENIDPDSDGSQYAYGENVGWVNAEPSGDGGPGMDVDNFELTGWIWGENFGWISLSCGNTSSCGSVSYGVTHDSFGVLSGFGWAENVGWVNFRPAGGGVTIETSTGSLGGHAWGENIGWISFNCGNTATCTSVDYKVKTGWTCTAAPPIDTPFLAVAKAGADAVLTWAPMADAGRFDIVQGGIESLRSSLSTSACAANDHIGTTVTVPDVPPAGDGFWFLVRAVNCGGNGTYNSPGADQVGDRDAEIDASTDACL
jgi:hypothetical protein